MAIGEVAHPVRDRATNTANKQIIPPVNIPGRDEITAFVDMAITNRRAWNGLTRPKPTSWLKQLSAWPAPVSRAFALLLLPNSQAWRSSASSPSTWRTAHGDAIGMIEVGNLTEIIAVDGSPLDNIDVLLDVDFVMNDGRVYKDRNN